jgi:tetratricopeptide (TPR) repeat protein
MPALPLSRNQLRGVICLTLALVTLLLYWPLTHYDFVNVDDPRFVIQNPHVQGGFTWQSVVWAFQTLYVETWQPITWFSHMLDCRLYGLKPGGHHLTSLLIHVANTLLVFLWLDNLTKATGRSAFVAALFAWHPLHVESVAWVCERKDVLSALFWLLALVAYTGYARKPGVGRYGLVLGLFALGLMSKPMVVTLPCVLLLVDFWPLNRFGLLGNLAGEKMAKPDTDPIAGGAFNVRALVRKSFILILEKIPFFVLGLGMTAITIYAENAGGTLVNVAGLPMHVRVANALASYQSYLSETFWPARLAYFYPYSFDLPLAATLGTALLLAVWTGCLVLRVRQQPYLLTGWLYFIGTLVPTIGLIQYCSQSRADRYMYLPSIGLFMVVVWGLKDVFERWPARRRLLPVLGGLALIGCLGASSVQIRYWQNSLTVARHAIEVTDNDYVAYESLGEAIAALGQPERAISFFAEAVRLAPVWPQGQFNYGITLSEIGQTNDAIEHLQAGVKLAPNFSEGHYRLGRTLFQFGKPDEAVPEFAETLRLDPNFAEAHYWLGQALQQQGKFAEAVPHYREALRQTPGFPEAKTALDQILSAHPDLK